MSARPGVAWQGSAAELFEEAMRIVPAVAKHRSNEDALMVAATYKSYLRTAEDFGIDPCAAWSILSSAYSVWLQNLFNLYATETEVAVGDAIDEAIASTAEWVANRA